MYKSVREEETWFLCRKREISLQLPLYCENKVLFLEPFEDSFASSLTSPCKKLIIVVVPLHKDHFCPCSRFLVIGYLPIEIQHQTYSTFVTSLFLHFTLVLPLSTQLFPFNALMVFLFVFPFILFNYSMVSIFQSSSFSLFKIFLILFKHCLENYLK